jgi:hypothetical protein
MAYAPRLMILKYPILFTNPELEAFYQIIVSAMGGKDSVTD